MRTLQNFLGNYSELYSYHVVKISAAKISKKLKKRIIYLYPNVKVFAIKYKHAVKSPVHDFHKIQGKRYAASTVVSNRCFISFEELVG